MCTAMMPSGAMCRAYSSIASRVIRCTGIESLKRRRWPARRSRAPRALQFALERQPRVADLEVERSLGRAEVGEVPAGDVDHLRIELVEAQRVAGAAVRRQGADAEADEAELHRPRGLPGGDGEADARAPGVVGAGLEAVLRPGELLAVQDHAVQQAAHLLLAAAGLAHAQRAVEAALHDDRPFLDEVDVLPARPGDGHSGHQRRASSMWSAVGSQPDCRGGRSPPAGAARARRARWRAAPAQTGPAAARSSPERRAGEQSHRHAASAPPADSVSRSGSGSAAPAWRAPVRRGRTCRRRKARAVKRHRHADVEHAAAGRQAQLIATASSRVGNSHSAARTSRGRRGPRRRARRSAGTASAAAPQEGHRGDVLRDVRGRRQQQRRAERG